MTIPFNRPHPTGKELAYLEEAIRGGSLSGDGPFTKRCHAWLREKTGALIVWGGNYYALPLTRGWLAWRKPDAPPSMAHLELAWTSYDMNAKMLDHSIAATNAERAGHPTQKPVRVMAWSLEFAPDARTVLDPFMGSGTTGVACAQLGKAFTGIERERKYFDIACERISRAQAQGSLIPLEQTPVAEQQAMDL